VKGVMVLGDRQLELTAFSDLTPGLLDRLPLVPVVAWAAARLGGPGLRRLSPDAGAVHGGGRSMAAVLAGFGSHSDPSASSLCFWCPWRWQAWPRQGRERG
jgi:hypothetical protein